MKNSSNREISRNRDPKWIPKMVDAKYVYATSPSKLRIVRMAQKKSQEEIALSNDLSHTTYGDIERGKRLVRKETAERIAGALSKKVTDLFEKQGKKFLAKK